MLENVGRRRFLASTLTTLFTAPLYATPILEKIYVMVLPVLHKEHFSNKLYSYDDIYRLVSDFRPDLVGLEVRQEDMDLDDAYLHRNYPTEMIYLARLYRSRAFGFDWLGDDLANRPIPDDWWTKQSRLKQLERSLNNTPLNTSTRTKMLNAQIEKLSDEQERIIKASTANQLADGKYDCVTSAYYKHFKSLVRGTPYVELSRFYYERDAHLVGNVFKILKGIRGGRVVIVTGADHHGPMVKALASLKTVELVQVPSASNIFNHGN